MRIGILTIFVLTMAATIVKAQQDCASIQASPAKFVSATATADNEQDARESATVMLVQQLQTQISSRSDFSISAGNDQSEQRFQNMSRSLSRLKVKGLQFKVCDGGKKQQGVSVMAYVSREDLNKSADDVRRKVEQYMELFSLKKEVGGNPVSEAHAAFLHTFYTPLAIPFKAEGVSADDLQAYLDSYLRSHLTGIRLSCVKVERHPQFPNEQVRLHLKLDGAASDMTYQLDCPALGASAEISSKGYDLLYTPSAPMETFKGMLTMRPMVLTDDLRELEAVVRVSREVTFEVDMMGIIDFDFAMERKGESLGVRPVLRFVNVNSFEWSTDGRVLSTEQSPTFAMSDLGSELTLTLNGNSRLSTSKNISSRSTSSSPIAAAPAPLPAPALPKAAETPGTPDDRLGLLGYPDFDALRSGLSALKEQGKAVFGKKAEFLRPERCWVVLVDADSKKVAHVLAPEVNGLRANLVTKQDVRNFEQQLKGFIAIWLEAY